MTIKYYKHEAESELGEGIAFMEVIDNEIVRQVEIYGNIFIWIDKSGQSDARFMLADKPASAIGLNPELEISVAEFETAWNQAKTATKCQ